MGTLSISQRTSRNRKTKIYYGKAGEASEGYEIYLDKIYHVYLKNMIDQHKITSVCDVGGGANPILQESYIDEQALNYSVLDISNIELEKAPATYHKILADIASPQFTIDHKFDLVFSKMLAEHVKDARQFHINVWNILRDGGFAIHFFPTLYTLPFIANRLIPEKLSAQILALLSTKDKYQYGKFPAYYHWCRGPNESQIQKFVDLGYEVLEYWGFFGHSGYYRKIKFLERLHEIQTHYLLKHPNPSFTSFAYLVLRKPTPK